MDQEICIIQTGGTIDKDYPKRIGGYAFEISQCAAYKILQRIYPDFKCTLHTVCRQDSQNITCSHRQKMVEVCTATYANRILITHGTDTMIETAEYLRNSNLNKIIVLTGAFKPETFKDSDAEFNVGFALGSLSCIVNEGVYVAMNGNITSADDVIRNEVTGNFEHKSYKTA